MPPQPRVTRVTGAGARTPLSEDCLTVSVVRRTGGRADKPVMVFVYGGAFGVGGADAIAYEGEQLAARGDVVFVGFNYRLSALGWLDLTVYSTPERPIESNPGLRDQLAALHWVQRNIAAFGGDPGNVTCFGESAGGTAVATLLTMPAARGLFVRAIVESATVGAVVEQERGRAWGAELVADLPGGADALHTATAEALVAATNRLDARVSDAQPGARVVGPVVDGDLVPEHPVDAFLAGRSLPVPLIIGTNADDGTLFQLFRGMRATPVRLERLFEQTVPEARDPILAEYPGRRRRMFGRFVTDLMFWHPSVAVAEGHARVAPVWMYRFDFSPLVMRLSGLGAMHGSELDYAFGRPGSALLRAATLLGGGRAARALMRRMHGRWVAFAEDGRVDDAWPRFDPERRRTLVLDATDRVEADPEAATRAAWAQWRSYD
jgi:para-nitrobenzyl esterase